MNKDILVIVMMAFGLLAILMLILTIVYARKHYNEKHLQEDYDDDSVDNITMEVIDIKINGKVYTFEAKNERLKKDEIVTLTLDGMVFTGTVTKENYLGTFNLSDNKPYTLVIKHRHEMPKKEVINEENMEFVPIKKR